MEAGGLVLLVKERQGGFKEIVFSLSGDGVYGLMKYRSGCARAADATNGKFREARPPDARERSMVLPEAEFDIDLKMEDIRKDTYCSSGVRGAERKYACW